MSEWVFTFGRNHVYPGTTVSLGRLFVAIEAADGESARAEMVRRFGSAWAFCYPSRAEAGVDLYLLAELRVLELPVVVRATGLPPGTLPWRATPLEVGSVAGLGGTVEEAVSHLRENLIVEVNAGAVEP